MCGKYLSGLAPSTAAQQAIYDEAYTAIRDDIFAAYNDPFASTNPEGYEKIADWAKAEMEVHTVAAATSGPTEDNIRITKTLEATLGACAEFACVPTPSKYRGGAHGCTSQPARDGKDSHHIPADSATAMPKAMGPAIQMDPVDHRQTLTYGLKKGSPRYALQQRLIDSGNVMATLALDIADVKRIAIQTGNPTKYDAAIAQVKAYATCLQTHGMLR